MRRIVLWTLLALLSGAVLSGSRWGPWALAHLEYFHVRRVEFDGLRYANAPDVLAGLQVDTTQSVWQPLAPLVERAQRHPMILSATVDRTLPGTIIVRVVEREPVAFAPFNGVLRPTDVQGRALPIDPVRTPLDVPIVAAVDSSVLRLLDALRVQAPSLYARVTEARRVGVDEVDMMLGPLRVRTVPNVTVARFRDILPVEADLARNHLRALELDLRFRDQVIARQP